MSSVRRLISHVALPVASRDVLVDSLNAMLALTFDLYTQVKQAHWNVRGMHFAALHKLFDEKAERLLGWTDQLAERAATLGGEVRGTARMVAHATCLPDYEAGAFDGKAHLSLLQSRYATMAAKLREAIELADDKDDPATADLLTQILAGTEMDLWFLESHLNV
jgi:starvation-inducible DNA-binding protein